MSHINAHINVLRTVRVKLNIVKPVNLKMGVARLRKGTELRAASGLPPPPGDLSPHRDENPYRC